MIAAEHTLQSKCLEMQESVLAIKVAADELTQAAIALVEAEQHVADVAEQQVRVA